MRSVTICSKVAVLACCFTVVACAGDDGERPVTFASTSALENPIAACQEQMATCQRGPGPGGGCEEQMRACMESYVAWMSAVRDGIAKCRADAGQCVASSSGGSALDCRGGYDQCIAALWNNPGGDDDEDAGVSVGAAGAGATAGAGGRSGYPGRAGAGAGAGAGGRSGSGRGGLTPPGGFTPPGSNGGRGFPGLPGASGAAGGGAAAGSGAPGLPGFPPPGGFPGAGQGQGFPGQGGPGLPTPPANPAAECMAKLTQCMTSGGDLAKCAEDARQCLRTDPLAALFTR